MFTTATLLALALHLLQAHTTPLNKRAGGPAIVPIPADCNVTNPLSTTTDHTSTTTYQVSPSFVTTHLLWSAYYDPFGTTDYGLTCLEQCHGYGPQGTCKSALQAYNVPRDYDVYGDSSELAPAVCLLFDAELCAGEFEPAVQGQYVNATVGNVACPGDV